ncbi:MAG: PLP-dependent aminotransferase family protein [Dialister sp.]|nr:PLP-dependent aminotransferase family protein [Dialister sp.]
MADISARRTPERQPIPAARQEEESEKWFADFTSNAIETDMFPFATWSRILRKTLTDEQDCLMRPVPVGGCLPLRKALANHLQRFRGMRVSPEQIIIGAGTEYMYNLIVRFLGLRRTICLEDPAYDKVRQVYESSGIACRYVPIDENGLPIQALRDAHASIVHVSPSHHFPTGRVMTMTKRYELLAWVNETDGRYIIEDDYDSEFRFTGKPVPALFSMDAAGKVIYMNTFSKTLTPTIRISYIVLPPELVLPFQKTLGFLSCTVPNFEQYALARFIRDGYFEKHVNRMRTYYRKKRDLLIRTLKKSALSGKSDIIERSSGLHFLLHLHTTCTDKELEARFHKKGLYMTPLSRYYHKINPDTSHTFLINYSSLPIKKIPEAVDRLCQAVLEK